MQEAVASLKNVGMWSHYLRLVSSEHVDHDLHDSLVHAQHSHQVGMLVENFVVHDVTEKHKKVICLLFKTLPDGGNVSYNVQRGQLIIKPLYRCHCIYGSYIFLPKPINHEFFLLLAHAY